MHGHLALWPPVYANRTKWSVLMTVPLPNRRFCVVWRSAVKLGRLLLLPRTSGSVSGFFPRVISWAYKATRLFIRSLLGSTAKQEGDIIRVRTGQPSLEVPPISVAHTSTQ